MPLFLCVVSIPPPAWLPTGGKYIINMMISKLHMLLLQEAGKMEIDLFAYSKQSHTVLFAAVIK